MQITSASQLEAVEDMTFSFKIWERSRATGFAIRLDRLPEALGKIETREPVHCILFSAERRKEAFHLASEKRKEGIQVVLQDINGVNNLDACSELYEDVTLLVGKAGKETPNERAINDCHAKRKDF